jgi:hypothetical protein
MLKYLTTPIGKNPKIITGMINVIDRIDSLKDKSVVLKTKTEVTPNNILFTSQTVYPAPKIITKLKKTLEAMLNDIIP